MKNRKFITIVWCWTFLFLFTGCKFFDPSKNQRICLYFVTNLQKYQKDLELLLHNDQNIRIQYFKKLNHFIHSKYMAGCHQCSNQINDLHKRVWKNRKCSYYKNNVLNSLKFINEQIIVKNLIFSKKLKDPLSLLCRYYKQLKYDIMGLTFHVIYMTKSKPS